MENVMVMESCLSVTEHNHWLQYMVECHRDVYNVKTLEHCSTRKVSGKVFQPFEGRESWYNS